jgi:ATP-dependent helicase HrpB
MKRLEESREAGKIVMLEPRRAAAVAAASRMAELINEKTGGRVGYSVRLERNVSERTRIEVLTEGLFIRRLQSDPSLQEIRTVIFDEFHERSVYTDLALAFMLDLRRMGSRVRMLLMSDTMDAAKTAAFLNHAENRSLDSEVPVIECPGSIFPVETEYLPLGRRFKLGTETADALERILAADTVKSKGDVLVFLPGKREIEDARSALAASDLPCIKDREILALHGSLPLNEQRKIIAPDRLSPRRRIILSTNIAETSLTIPGITLVVDTGYVRLERFHIPTGMNRLALENASMRSADQRRGRAGRLEPGACVRLWEQGDARPEETEPAIRRVDLSGLALECLIWGLSSRESLMWLETPPDAAWQRSMGLLALLGASDKAGKVTDKGRELARLGLEPRLASLCVAGRAKGLLSLACVSAAILSERDGSGIAGDGDFRRRLETLRSSPGSQWSKTIAETAGDLMNRMGNNSGPAFSWTMEEEAGVGELLAEAFPDRIARNQGACGTGGVFRFPSGREARIEGPLENAEWIAAAEVDAGERLGFIRLAAPLSAEKALELLEKDAAADAVVEWKGLVPRTILRRSAGRLLLLEEKRQSTREEAAAALPALLAEKGLGVLPWDEEKGACLRLLERIRFFAANAKNAGLSGTGTLPEPGAWTGEALIRDAVLWLGPFVWDSQNPGAGPVFSNSSLKNALKTRLGWDLSAILDREVPGVFTLPSGRPRALDYRSGEPVLSARLQDCFGIAVHPRILGVPVVFHLLSPADRPIQITSDLPGFWKGSYAEVRKEMKGRYPKHRWPDSVQLLRGRQI